MQVDFVGHDSSPASTYSPILSKQLSALYDTTAAVAYGTPATKVALGAYDTYFPRQVYMLTYTIDVLADHTSAIYRGFDPNYTQLVDIAYTQSSDTLAISSTRNYIKNVQAFHDGTTFYIFFEVEATLHRSRADETYFFEMSVSGSVTKNALYFNDWFRNWVAYNRVASLVELCEGDKKVLGPYYWPKRDILVWGDEVRRFGESRRVVSNVPHTYSSTLLTTNLVSNLPLTENGGQWAWDVAPNTVNDVPLGSLGAAAIHPTKGYLVLPGLSGNNASTPDSVAASITGDLDLRVEAQLDDWTPGSVANLLRKDDFSTQRSYYLRLNSTGTLLLSWNDGVSSTGVTSTAALALAAGTKRWVRATLDVDNGAGGYAVNFYTSVDGSTWTALGNEVVGVSTTTVNDSTADVLVGDSTVAGIIHKAQIYNGIGGTLAVDFDPARDTSASVSSFASSTTGETWTINATGTDADDPVWSASGLTLTAATSYLDVPDRIRPKAQEPITILLALTLPGSAPAATSPRVVSIGETVSTGLRLYRTATGSFKTEIEQNSVSAAAETWSKPDLGSTILVGLRFDGYGVSVIHNNTIESTTLSTLSLDDNTGFRIGSRSSDNGEHFTGLLLHHVAVYDRGLDAIEVDKVYHALKQTLAGRGITLR